MTRRRWGPWAYMWPLWLLLFVLGGAATVTYLAYRNQEGSRFSLWYVCVYDERRCSRSSATVAQCYPARRGQWSSDVGLLKVCVVKMMLENPGAIKHALFLFAMFAVQLVAIAAKIDGNRRGCRECTVCLAAVLTACAWFCSTFTGWPLPWSVSLVPVALGLLSLACMPCFGWVFGQGGARVAFFFVYVVRALRGRMMGGLRAGDMALLTIALYRASLWWALSSRRS